MVSNPRPPIHYTRTRVPVKSYSGSSAAPVLFVVEAYKTVDARYKDFDEEMPEATSSEVVKQVKIGRTTLVEFAFFQACLIYATDPDAASDEISDQSEQMSKAQLQASDMHTFLWTAGQKILSNSPL